MVARTNQSKALLVPFITVSSLVFLLSRAHHFWSAELQLCMSNAKLVVVAPPWTPWCCDISKRINSKLSLSFPSVHFNGTNRTILSMLENCTSLSKRFGKYQHTALRNTTQINSCEHTGSNAENCSAQAAFLASIPWIEGSLQAFKEKAAQTIHNISQN